MLHVEEHAGRVAADGEALPSLDDEVSATDPIAAAQPQSGQPAGPLVARADPDGEVSPPACR